MSTPYSVHIFDEVTSTQDVARSLFRRSPVVVIAARQTQGRGRSGRTWQSAPRAVAVTAVFDVAITFGGWPQERFSLMPLVAGLAAVSQLPEAAALKWPNDLLIGDRKLGGILVEAGGTLVAVGCGINLWWPDAPPGRGALFEKDPGPHAYVGWGVQVVEALWQRLAAGPDRWGFAEYRSRCVTIGKRIDWDTNRSGLAVGIDESSGALLVETDDGGLVRLNAGEVRH